jgi:probable HAF family extracellular repeat protein
VKIVPEAVTEGGTVAPHPSEDTRRRRTRWWLLALIAVAVLVPTAVAAYLVDREPPEPMSLPFAVTAGGTIVDLGTLGGTWGTAADINTDGAVVGFASATDAKAHAFLSRGGTMIDLGASRCAVALNDGGQVLVASLNPGPAGWEPFLWTEGATRELTSELGPLWEATDMDERGRVVGVVKAAPRLYTWPTDDNSGTTDTITPIGVVWENGRATLLETADAMISRAISIDDNGAVLGQGRVKGSYSNHVLLWRASSISDLGEGGAIAMNNREQIVLQKQEDDDPGKPSLCYLWEAGLFTPLNSEDGTNLRAYGINESGVVAGQANDRAAVWQSGHITILKLGSKSSWAAAINDAGTMVGTREK